MHELDEALALFGAEQVGRRDADVLEEELGGVLALHADLVEHATAGEAGSRGRDDDQRDAGRGLVRVGLRDDQTTSAWAPLVMKVFAPLTTYSSPSLIALVLMFCRSEPVPGSVIAIAPTASPEASFGQPLLLLLVGAVGLDVVGHDAGVERGAPRRVADVRLLLDQDGLVGEGAATAAVLLRDRGTQQTDLAGLVPQVAVDLLVVDVVLDVRLDLLLAEGAREVAEVREVLIHPAGHGAGHESPPGRRV
jgi:hypothetical protein